MKRRVLCAAPGYVAAHGQPKQPADLQQHDCLVMRFGQTLDNIWYFGTGSRRQSVEVKGRRVANDGALVRQWCLEGHGIMLKSEQDVASDLRSGRLLELLPDYASPPLPLQIIFPPARAQPRRIRAFADYLESRFATPADGVSEG